MSRIIEIANIGAEAEANASADRRQDDASALLVIGAEAANEIGRPVDAREALEKPAWVAHVINEREDF